MNPHFYQHARIRRERRRHKLRPSSPLASVTLVPLSKSYNAALVRSKISVMTPASESYNKKRLYQQSYNALFSEERLNPDDSFRPLHHSTSSTSCFWAFFLGHGNHAWSKHRTSSTQRKNKFSPHSCCACAVFLHIRMSPFLHRKDGRHLNACMCIMIATSRSSISCFCAVFRMGKITKKRWSLDSMFDTVLLHGELVLDKLSHEYMFIYTRTPVLLFSGQALACIHVYIYISFFYTPTPVLLLPGQARPWTPREGTHRIPRQEDGYVQPFIKHTRSHLNTHVTTIDYKHIQEHPEKGRIASLVKKTGKSRPHTHNSHIHP